MKKTLKFVALGILALTMAGCAGNKNCSSNNGNDEDKIYTGVLPAADADGVRYTLKLDYDDDHNYTDGDYSLVQTYLVNDSTYKIGNSDKVSFKSKGDFTVIDGQGANAADKYIKLVPKARSEETLYFLVKSPDELVLVDSAFQQSETPGLNYTLRLVK